MFRRIYLYERAPAGASSTCIEAYMTHPDTSKYASNDALVAALTEIKTSPRGWNGQTATELLAYAARRLSGVARSEGIPIETAATDIITAVWTIWERPTIFGAESAWGWTAAGVRRELAHESTAARLLTSTNARSRIDFDADVHFADDELDSIETERRLLHHGQGPVSSGASRPVFKTLALRTAVGILTSAGHSLLVAEAAVEAVADLGSASKTLASAADHAKRDLTVANALGVDPATWRTLIVLILGGAPIKDESGTATGTNANAGLIAAERLGLPFAEVKSIRNATKRLAS